jgi:hypothetical protein
MFQMSAGGVRHGQVGGVPGAFGMANGKRG